MEAFYRVLFVFMINSFGFFMSLNASMTILQGFNDNSSLIDNFNQGGATGTFEWSATSGLDGGGGIYINPAVTTDQIWTTKDGYSIASDGKYTLSAYFKMAANSGYGALGFSTLSTNTNSGSSGTPGSGNFLGISFHGGGGNWINDGIGDSLSWDGSDMISNPSTWYFFELNITAIGGNNFDLTFEIYNSSDTGVIGTRHTSHSTTLTNANIASASKIHVFFSADGQRTGAIDNFKIVLDGGAQYVPQTGHITINSNPTTCQTPEAGKFFSNGDCVVNRLDIESNLSVSRDVLIIAGGDILINSDITKSSGNDANLTLKAHRDITIDSSIAISSSSGKLNTIFWSDSDANEVGGVLLYENSQVATNGGHIWIGGGSGSATWNGLSVGDGYAVGLTALTFGQSYAGINFVGAELNASSGDLYAYGKSTQTTYRFGIGTRIVGSSKLQGHHVTLRGIGSVSDNVNSDNSRGNWGIDIEHTSSLSATGNIYLEGRGGGQNTNDGNIHYGVVIAGSAKVQTVGESNITIIGLGGGKNGATNNNDNDGVRIDGTASISTADGHINISGIKGQNSLSQGIHINSGTIRSTNGGNIYLNTDSIEIGSSPTLQTNGSLIIAPYSYSEIIVGHSTEVDGSLTLIDSIISKIGSSVNNLILENNTSGDINISGNITLQTNSEFLTSGDIFQNGDTNISKNLKLESLEGRILINGNILKDSGDDANLTLRAANYITTATPEFIDTYVQAATTGLTSTIKSTHNRLNIIINSDSNKSDAILGGFWLPYGTSVHSNGGDVTIGGGDDPSSDYAIGSNTLAYEWNSLMRGVAINGDINASGGGVIINAQGSTSGSVGHARGFHMGGSIITSGEGNITIRGKAKGGSDGVAFGDSVNSRYGYMQSERGDIRLIGIKGSGKSINSGLVGSVIEINSSGNLIIEADGEVSGDGVFNLKDGDFRVLSSSKLAVENNTSLSLGDINTSGDINISTTFGDINITNDINTTSTSNIALIINAGSSKSSGDSSGGDIKVYGSPSINIGSGGVGRFYSGSESNSTALSSLVGGDINASRIFYDADETNSTLEGISSGLYAIYRGEKVSILTPYTLSLIPNRWNLISSGKGKVVDFSDTNLTSQLQSGRSYWAYSLGAWIENPNSANALMGVFAKPKDNNITISNYTQDDSSNKNIAEFQDYIKNLDSTNWHLVGIQDNLSWSDLNGSFAGTKKDSCDVYFFALDSNANYWNTPYSSLEANRAIWVRHICE